MNQQQAKQAIFGFLYQMLDDGNIAEFIMAEIEPADEYSADYARMDKAVKQIRDEMLRRSDIDRED